jgi:hypothetical protein
LSAIPKKWITHQSLRVWWNTTCETWHSCWENH